MILLRGDLDNWQKNLGLNYETQTITQTKNKITVLVKTEYREVIIV